MPATGAESDEEQAVLSRQLSVIPEMLATLDTLTTAGQHHTIGKVVRFIEGQVRHAIPRVGGRNQATLAELMERLKQESERQHPDPASVSRHATTLMTLIAAVQSGTRTFTFPDQTYASHVRAELKSGELTVVIPKTPAAVAKRIPVALGDKPKT